MPNVFELEASLGIDSSKFKKGIKEAIDEAEKLRKELQKAADETKDLGKEVDKEGDEAEEGAEDNKKLGKEVKSAGDNAKDSSGKFKELAGSIKDGLAEAAKIGVAAVTAAGAGITAVVKQSLDEYGEYEQLAGGIQKIFGDVSDKVIENAENAVSTSAASINEYLSGITGFSQTLIQSLSRGEQTDIDELKEQLDAEYTATKNTLADEYDAYKEYWNDRIKASKKAKDGEAEALTKQRDEELKALKRSNEEQLNQLKAHNKEVVAETERANQQTGEVTEEIYNKAAEYGDMIMRNIADNASTFGKYTAQELQNVYNALSRGSYMTLDNLNLGYKGTKEEMERLIADANDYAEAIGEPAEMTIDSFADIARAIDLIQRKIGISETAANEASRTVTGSMKAVKDSWKNMLIEMSKPEGDIGKSFETLGANIEAMVGNMWPKIENALGGVGKLVEKAAPKITEAFKTAIPKVLPSLITTASKLVSSVGTAVLQSLPDLLTAGQDILATLADGIANANFNGDGIIGKILDSLTENAPVYFDYAEKILAGIGNAMLNADYAKLGKSLGSMINAALNSMTNLLVDVDMKKVGSNVADFINNMPWKDIAHNVIELLGAALGSLGNIAAGFFEDIKGVEFLNAITLLAAPKLLSGMLTAFKGPSCSADWTSITQYLGQTIGSSGTEAGLSWSSTFLAAVKAFGLGWAIGTWIRETIDDNEAEKIDKQTQIETDYGQFTTTEGKTGIKYDVNSPTGYNDLYLDMAEQGKVVYSSMADKVATMQGLVNRDKEISDFYFSPYMQEFQDDAFKKSNLSDIENQFKNEFAASDKKYNDSIKYSGSQNVSYGTPSSVLEEMAKRAKHNAIGNYIKEPTLTWAGEDEPEYMIPESKMSSVYPRETTQNITINIKGTFDLATPEDRQRLIEEMSAELRMLSISQQRAMGGAAW